MENLLCAQHFWLLGMRMNKCRYLVSSCKTIIFFACISCFMHYESKYTWGFGTGKVIFIWNRQGRSFGITWMGFWRISVQGFEVYQAATVGGCHFRYGSSICKERKDFLKIASHLRATRSTFRLLEHEGAWGWRDQYGLGYVNPCRPVKELDLYLVRNGEPMKGSTGEKKATSHSQDLHFPPVQSFAT